MSEITQKDYYCNSCHSEFIFDVEINEDITEEEIRFCPLCGKSYDIDLDLKDINFENDMVGDWD